MIPYTPHPTYELFGVTFQTWGTFIALAFLVSVLWVRREEKRAGRNPDQITTLAMWMILASLVGGRLVYVLGNIWEFRDAPLSAFAIWDGGMAMFGGIFGAIVAMAIGARMMRRPFLQLADTFAFVMPLGVFVGRIGCHLIADHIGRRTTLPIGFIINGEGRFETAIVESVFGLVLFGIFVFLKRRQAVRKAGFYTILFLAVYSLFRFFSDFLRASDLPIVDARFDGLTLTQYFSMIIVAGLLAVLVFKKGLSPNALLKRNGRISRRNW
ncbi:MAG: prolipoprotein diacylglyceryl transferase [Candidatus Kerfeldbacteria bacterium]|nr:prolipoprotein diacylglyceryl transferase [Candidatus Kerfeldbacteria bacterium]